MSKQLEEGTATITRATSSCSIAQHQYYSCSTPAVVKPTVGNHVDASAPRRNLNVQDSPKTGSTAQHSTASRACSLEVRKSASVHSPAQRHLNATQRLILAMHRVHESFKDAIKTHKDVA